MNFLWPSAKLCRTFVSDEKLAAFWFENVFLKWKKRVRWEIGSKSFRVSTHSPFDRSEVQATHWNDAIFVARPSNLENDPSFFSIHKQRFFFLHVLQITSKWTRICILHLIEHQKHQCKTFEILNMNLPKHFRPSISCKFSKFFNLSQIEWPDSIKEKKLKFYSGHSINLSFSNWEVVDAVINFGKKNPYVQTPRHSLK